MLPELLKSPYCNSPPQTAAPFLPSSRVVATTDVEAGPSFYERHGFHAEEDTRTDFIFLDEPMPVVRYVKTVRKRSSTPRKKK